MKSRKQDDERSFKLDVEESIELVKQGNLTESLKLMLVARRKRKSVVDFRNYTIGVLYESDLESDLVDIFALLIEVYGENVLANPDIIDVETEINWKDFYQTIQKIIQGQIKLSLPQHGMLSPIMQMIIVPEIMKKYTQMEFNKTDNGEDVEAVQGLNSLFDKLVKKERPLSILEKSQVNHLLSLDDNIPFEKLMPFLNRDRDFVFQTDILQYIHQHHQSNQEITLKNIYDDEMTIQLDDLFDIEINQHFLDFVSYVEDEFVHEPFRVAYLMENIYDIFSVMYPFTDELGEISPEDMVEGITQLMEAGDPQQIDQPLLRDIYHYWFFEYMQNFASFE